MIGEPDQAVFITQVLEHILSLFGQGQSRVGGVATNLFINLAILELCFFFLWIAVAGNGSAVDVFKKIIYVTVIYFVITNYSTVLRIFVDSFVKTGELAGSPESAAAGLSVDDPGSILIKGYALAEPFALPIQQTSWYWWGLAQLVTFVFYLGLLFCYGLLTVIVFVARLEFGVLSTLGLIFIPFAVFKPTKFIAEKIFGAFIASGAKLMAIAFILSIVGPIISELQFTEVASTEDLNLLLSQLFNYAVANVALIILTLKGPSMMMGFLSGGAVLGLSSAFQAGGFAKGAAATSAGAAIYGLGGGGGFLSGAGSFLRGGSGGGGGASGSGEDTSGLKGNASAAGGVGGQGGDFRAARVETNLGEGQGSKLTGSRQLLAPKVEKLSSEMAEGINGSDGSGENSSKGANSSENISGGARDQSTGGTTLSKSPVPLRGARASEGVAPTPRSEKVPTAALGNNALSGDGQGGNSQSFQTAQTKAPREVSTRRSGDGEDSQGNNETSGGSAAQAPARGRLSEVSAGLRALGGAKLKSGLSDMNRTLEGDSMSAGVSVSLDAVDGPR